MLKNSLSVLLLLLLIPYLYAQKDDGAIEDAQIIIVKERDIKLEEKEKKFETVNIPTPEPAPVTIQLKAKTFDVQTDKQNPKPPISQIEKAKLKRLNNGYFALGAGNNLSSFAEIKYANKRNEDYEYVLGFDHLASQNGPYDDAGNSENQFQALGAYYLGEWKASLDLNYRRRGMRYYGYRRPAEVDEDSIRQVYNQISADLKFSRFSENRNLDIIPGFKFSRITDRFEASESIYQPYIRSSLKINSRDNLQIDADLTISSFSDSANYNRNFFRVNPSYVVKRDDILLKIGTTILYTNDSAEEINSFNLFPDLYGSYRLSGEQAIAFVHLNGDMQYNTFHDLTNTNPFLQSNIGLTATSNPFGINGGVKGTLFENKIKYEGSLFYRVTRYQQYFANDPTDISRFISIYDPGNTSISGVNLSADYNFKEKLRAGISTTYQNYTTGDFDFAIHVPNLLTEIYGSYNYRNKVIFNTVAFIRSGIQTFDPNTAEKTTLKTAVDINAGAQYNFSNKFSTFLQVNNVLSQEYEMYLNYPQRNLTLMIGGKYIF